MTAPTYRKHGTGHVCRMTDQQCVDPSAVPAVVLTASEEDVERLARAIAASQEARWGDLDEGTRFSRLTHARAYIAALLAPPVPPEPSMSDRRLDRDGYEWARSAQSVHWHVLGDIARIGMPWADLWAERGPLREVE